MIARAEGSKKKSKSAVNFEHPAEGVDRCEDCKYFIAASDACKKVNGNIQPEDWCKLFSRRGK